ncbi:MAG TPA: hypothetical protein VF868_15990 [Bacteroidia bacterium]|jgi:hypothetical protein
MIKKLVKGAFNRLASNLQTSIQRNYELMLSQESEIEIVKMLLGKSLSSQVKQMKSINSLHDVEFKVFSQFGDDGIIQYLINKIDIPDKTFVEFGVEDYYEANTRFLLMNDNWRGLIMDGSAENLQKIKQKNYQWKYDVLPLKAFIDMDNINELIASANFGKDLGILSIDIDGNDYWIWKAIHVVNPVIVIVEYNSVLGFENPWTVPYDPKFYRGDAYFNNLYYGSSLLSLCDLAEEKGYYFIGCNSAGNNSYFVRKDKIGDIKTYQAREGYVLSNFAESKNKEGKLSYLRGEARLASLKGLTIYNTRLGKTESI